MQAEHKVVYTFTTGVTLDAVVVETLANEDITVTVDTSDGQSSGTRTSLLRVQVLISEAGAVVKMFSSRGSEPSSIGIELNDVFKVTIAAADDDAEFSATNVVSCYTREL